MGTGSDSELEQFRARRRVERPGDYRSPAEQDRDRILYSSAFRRLGGVTQVVGVGERQVFHTRLTHSLKVAQVGRRLAEKLVKTESPDRVQAAGGIDGNVVEAAALAHDLGHPPFGHVAEKALQDIFLEDKSLEGLDSFEGNAQSFRIVTKLAFRTMKPDEPALNLTRATLRAILKYPWFFGEHPTAAQKDKWGAFRSETEDFEFATEGTASKKMSVEAEIMDWADDISYAVHDVEDFYRVGVIPLDRLVNSSKEANAFIARAVGRLSPRGYEPDVCSEAFENILASGLLPREQYGGTRPDRAALHTLASSLLTRYISALTLLPNGTLNTTSLIRHEVAMLKQLTWYYAIDNPALATLQRGHREVIQSLFRRLREWVFEAALERAEQARLPRHLREFLTATRDDREAVSCTNGDDALLRTRAVIDYIAYLTEHQAIELHERLTGGSAASALDMWLR